MCAVVNGNPMSSDLARRALQQFLDAAAASASATAVAAAAPVNTTVSSSAAVSGPSTSNGNSRRQLYASAIADSAAEAVSSTDANNPTIAHQPSIELGPVPAPTSHYAANATPTATQLNSLMPQPQINAPASTADKVTAVTSQTTAPQRHQSLPTPQVLKFLGQHSHANGVADTMFEHLDTILKNHEAGSSSLVYWYSAALDSFAILIMSLPGMFACISDLWTYNCVGLVILPSWPCLP